MGGVAVQLAADSDTFPKLLARNAAVRGGRPAYRHKDLGVWQTWTWAEVDRISRSYAAGLRAIGLRRGDSIAIIGANRPKLYWSMMAAQMLGAVPVPVYADAVAEELAYVLAHAEARFAAVQDQEQVDKVLSILDRCPGLERLVYDEPRGLHDYDHARLLAIDEVVEKGERLLADESGVAQALDAEIAAGKASDLAIILYTSGTTGRPKGVMLTHASVIVAARIGCDFDRLSETEDVIAYLPIAWVGDHVFSYAQSLYAGYCVNCPETAETVIEDRREIGTTYAFAPPRVYENLLTLTMVRMEDAGWLKRRMFHTFLGLAKTWGERILDRDRVPLHARALYALGNALVYGPLRNRFGLTRIRVAYTAGEAIGPDIFRFYRAIGVNLKQLYGQTEAGVYITMQPDGEVRADTVGRPAPMVEIRIDESGEVLYRSPSVFEGYFKEPEKTREVKTPDGFVRSGDAGFFTEDGHVKIIDRVKDVGRLDDGTLFAPKYIENKLKFFPNIKEAVAFGDRRSFVAVFINIDLTAVGDWAERNDIVYGSYQELAGHAEVYRMIAGHVRQVNSDLAGEPAMAGAQIRRFLILHKELDADDGELTRTLKVRRSFIAEKYAPLIRALYDGSRQCFIRTEVTFEDGRKGTIEANVRVEDMDVTPSPAGLRREAAE